MSDEFREAERARRINHDTIVERERKLENGDRERYQKREREKDFQENDGQND